MTNSHPLHAQSDNKGSDRDRGSDRDSERGSAPLEFIVVGLILLVPLIYLIVALGQIQEQSLGVEAGARHVARTIATSTDSMDARATSDLVLASVADAYGMNPERLDLSLRCQPVEAMCPSAGATLIVTVRTAVSLPMVPPVWGLDALASVPIEATAIQKVSRSWGVTP